MYVVIRDKDGKVYDKDQKIVIKSESYYRIMANLNKKYGFNTAQKETK